MWAFDKLLKKRLIISTNDLWHQIKHTVKQYSLLSDDGHMRGTVEIRRSRRQCDTENQRYV
jgi:hypothetical protein